MTKIEQFNNKKRKSTLPNIASLAMMDTCEEDDNNNKYDKEKEVECPDENSTVEMEEGVNDRKYDSNEKMMRGKVQNAHMTLPLLILRKV